MRLPLGHARARETLSQQGGVEEYEGTGATPPPNPPEVFHPLPQLSANAGITRRRHPNTVCQEGEHSSDIRDTGTGSGST